MARKRRIIVIHNGLPAEKLVSRPPAPRNLRVWLEACASVASQSEGGHFATRMGGQWAAYSVWNRTGFGWSARYGAKHVRDFPTEDAAAMWMLYKAKAAA